MDIVNQSGDVTWAQSMTKLRFFELTQYQRLIYFDADGLIMRRMDHLFSLPSAPVAMPRAYWLTQPAMCNALAVVEPSAQRLQELLRQAETAGKQPPQSFIGDKHVALLPHLWLSHLCTGRLMRCGAGNLLRSLVCTANWHEARAYLGAGGFDMDVMNDLYKGQCLVLPNEYVFLTGELRATNHTRCAPHGTGCRHALPYS